MYTLLAICLVLHPMCVDESIQQSLREKNFHEKMYKIEIMISWPLLLHPFRRTALCHLDQAGDGDGAGKVAEDVNVIFHAIDEDGLAADILKRARHVGVQAGAEFGVFEKGNAVLCAEDDMQDDAGEGLRHNGAGLLRPVGAFADSVFPDPALRSFLARAGLACLRAFGPQHRASSAWVASSGCRSEIGRASCRERV